jgi:hypothetical protein
MKRLNNDRKFPDGVGPRPDRSAFKREMAAERQAAYDNLSIEDKLAKLDRDLGPGQGANRQRAKLMAKLESGLDPMWKQAGFKDEAAYQEYLKTKPKDEQMKLPAQKHGLKAKDRRNNERKDSANE